MLSPVQFGPVRFGNVTRVVVKDNHNPGFWTRNKESDRVQSRFQAFEEALLERAAEQQSDDAEQPEYRVFSFPSDRNERLVFDGPNGGPEFQAFAADLVMRQEEVLAEPLEERERTIAKMTYYDRLMQARQDVAREYAQELKLLNLQA